MLKGYRTYVAASIMAGVGFLVEMDWAKFMDDPKGGAGFLVGGLVMAIMRAITTTPAGKAAGESTSHES